MPGPTGVPGPPAPGPVTVPPGVPPPPGVSPPPGVPPPPGAPLPSEPPGPGPSMKTPGPDGATPGSGSVAPPPANGRPPGPRLKKLPRCERASLPGPLGRDAEPALVLPPPPLFNTLGQLLNPALSPTRKAAAIAHTSSTAETAPAVRRKRDFLQFWLHHQPSCCRGDFIHAPHTAPSDRNRRLHRASILP